MRKNYKWFGSIGNANTSNEKSKLKSYLKLGSKLMVSLWLVLLFTNLQAQTPMTAPALEWEKSYWPTTRPVTGSTTFINQTRVQSGEDWFYSITKSLNTSNVQNGYMCSGYNSFVNYSLSETTGCLDNTDVVSFKCEEFEKVDYRKGMVEGMISFVDLEGNKLWHKNLREGELTKIIRTSDGNYLAVGSTLSTETIGYNPTTGHTNDFFKKRDEVNDNNHECGSSYRNKRKAYIIKFDSEGEKIWEYIYGLQDFIAGDPVAYLQNTWGLDVLEQDGFYYLTGFAVNPAQSSRYNNYIIKVDEDGLVQNKRFIGNLSLWGKGGTVASYKDPITNVISLAVGTETTNVIDPNDPSQNIYDAKIIVLDVNNLNELNPNTIPNTTTNVYWSINPNPTKSTRVWGITFNRNGDLWFPVATNCEECSESFHGKADNLIVYKINISNGNIIGTPTHLGNVIAYDLRMGITNTADGGFAIISSKLNLNQTYKPLQSTDEEGCIYYLEDENNNVLKNGTKYWRSCAYVAKCDANGLLEWQKQWDAKTPRQSGAMSDWNYPDLNFDVKTQECMYSIVQNDDESYTVAGNNSTNFDDEYLVKVNGDCDQRVANSNFDVVNNSNTLSIYPNYKLTADEVWNTSKKVKASIIIPFGKTLTINGTRTIDGLSSSTIIEFADSRKTGVRTNIIVEYGGQLIINGAMLTSLASCASTNSKWDGILVEGQPTLNQITRANQGYVHLNDAIVENALNAISTSSYYFTPNLGASILWDKTGGGIIKANNTIFRKNKRHIEFMAYKNNVYVNATTTAEYSNVSSFYNCSFEMEGTNFSNDLNSSKRTMVTAWGIKGVRFTACDFKNNTGALNADKEFYDRGTGIYALDASLIVDGSINASCADIKRGTFDDLTTGIQNVSYVGATKMSVYKYLNFTKNDKSVWMVTGNTATIHNNNFNLNVPSTYYNVAYGTNSNSFKTGVVGVFANYMGAYVMEKNTFSDALQRNKIIVGTILDNSDKAATGGKVRLNEYNGVAFGSQTHFDNKTLNITCNEYENIVTSAIHLNPFSNTSASITPDFGLCGTAGNPASINDRKDYKNEFKTNPFNDMNNYLAATKTYVVEPTAVNIPINVINVNVDNCIQQGGVTPKEPCIVTPSLSCTNTVPNPNEIVAKYQTTKEAIINLDILINSGNLTETGMQEAMVDKSYYQKELQINRGEILWAYNTWEGKDTTINAVDSIIAFLVNETDLASKKILVAAYYSKGNYSSASVVLGTITNTSNDEETNQFKNYYNLIINANANNRNIYQLTEAEWATLDSIANTQTSAAESAKGILMLVKGNNYDINIERNTNTSLGKTAKTNIENIENAKNTFLNVYPNPSNSIVNISYTINELTENTTICLLDITGKQLFTQKINEKNGVIQLDALKLKSGFYFIRLSDGNTQNIVSKIIITH